MNDKRYSISAPFRSLIVVILTIGGFRLFEYLLERAGFSTPIAIGFAFTVFAFASYWFPKRRKLNLAAWAAISVGLGLGFYFLGLLWF
ncbi:MAG TPA: hypothetical protein VE135_04425 [Pyrinomonadaceae bacterium]|nr:hypothetical protein [Pyrinomonadaceae bacterium]